MYEIFQCVISVTLEDMNGQDVPNHGDELKFHLIHIKIGSKDIQSYPMQILH